MYGRPLKKGLVLACAVLAAAVLASCGGAGDPPPPAADTPEPTAAPAVFTRGAWDGDSYANESIGLSFALPENWAAATEEEIAAVYGDSEEGLVYDMAATNLLDGSTMVVMVQDMSGLLGGSATTAQGYGKLLRKELEAVETPKYAFEDGAEYALGGEAYWLVPAGVQMDDGSEMELSLLIRKSDNQMIILMIYTVGETTLSDLAPAFDGA